MEIVVRGRPASSSWDAFLTISPYAENGISHMREQLRGCSYPRRELVDLLKSYNASIGNGSSPDRLLDSDTYCVVTGQQVGLFGGPIYTILKAITCLQLARESGAVPIFWAATEDHDISEVDHTFHLDDYGNLQKLSLLFPLQRRLSVEDLELTEVHVQRIKEFQDRLNVPSSMRVDCVRGESFGKAMIEMLVRLFAGTGLIFVEPRLLRPLAKPFFITELMNKEKITAILQETAQRLISAGGKAFLDVAGGSALFLKGEGNRRDKIGTVSKELVKLVQEEPHRFSTGAAARTVLQSLLIPTLAYVAGPGELNYYCQLKEYHHFYGIPMPWAVPRLSATFIPQIVKEWLTKCGLKPWDSIPKRWEEFKGEKNNMPDHALHFMNNLLYPRGKPQERVLNWWEFQGKTQENLAMSLYHHTNWREKGHHYCYTRYT